MELFSKTSTGYSWQQCSLQQIHRNRFPSQVYVRKYRWPITLTRRDKTNARSLGKGWLSTRLIYCSRRIADPPGLSIRPQDNPLESIIFLVTSTKVCGERRLKVGSFSSFAIFENFIGILFFSFHFAFSFSI